MIPDIICPGEPVLEFNRRLDGNYLPSHEGDTSNCTIPAACQGASAGFCTLAYTIESRKLIGALAFDSVDATATGDTFDVAILAEFAIGSDPIEATHFANAAVALSTQGYVAFATLTRRASVLEIPAGPGR